MEWPRIHWGRATTEDSYEPLADARRTEEAPPRNEDDLRERLRRARLRRGALSLGLGTLFVAGSLAALVGRGGYLDLARKREEARRLREEVAVLRVEVGVLEQHVGRLESDPFERERVAREQLGLILPGEIDFLLPREDSGDPAPGTPTEDSGPDTGE